MGIWHGGRQEIGILGNKSSVRQRSSGRSPPRRRRSTAVHLTVTETCASEQKLSPDMMSWSSDWSQWNHRRGTGSPKCGWRPATSSTDRFNCSACTQPTTLLHYLRNRRWGGIAYMFYRCFFVIFPSTKNMRQPFSGTAERIFYFHETFTKRYREKCSLQRRAAAWRMSCRRLANGECWWFE